MKPSIQSSKYCVVLLLSLSYFLLGINRCDSYSQSTKDLFYDNQVPAVLVDLMNPPLSAESLTYIQQKDPHNRMVVAVIDNGTDYQALYKNIHFDKSQNEEITGAGLDLLGQDNWAHPNTIDASLFAFGAKSINDKGQIIEPKEDPLSYYNEHNEAFMDQLLKALKSHQFLQTTLFKKITKNSLSLMGVVQWAEGKYDFNHKIYNERKEAGRLIDWNSRSNAKVHNDFIYTQHKLYSIIELPWLMGPELGIPVFTSLGETSTRHSFVSQYQGSEQFYKLIRSVYQDYCNASDFQKDLDTYIRFRELRPSDSGKDSIYESRKTSAELIHNAWFRQHFSYVEADPLANIAAKFRSSIAISDREYFNNSLVPIPNKDKHAQAILTSWFSKLDVLYKKIQTGDWLSESQKDNIQKNIKNTAEFQAKINELLAKRGIARLYQERVLKKDTSATDYGTYGRLIGNPYLEGSADYLDTTNSLKFSIGQKSDTIHTDRSPLEDSHNATSAALAGSQGISHGTHTAGTIIGHSKNKMVDVWPIRVTTSSLALSEFKQNLLAHQFLDGFAKWLELPIVAYAVKVRVDSHITTANFDIDINTKAPNPQVQKSVFEHMTKNVLRTVRESSLDYDFFEQILAAIRAVAKNKIAIASMSLGLLHKKAVPSVTGNLAKNEWQELNKFLKYEYYKYYVGKTLAQDAPNTLFLVAAGNDGAWIDGHSKSALPAGLESPFLDQYETAFKTQVPNNHLVNLLAIGSLAKDHHFSSFTNILIHKDILYGIGESVVSTIKLSDHLGTQQAYTIENKNDLIFLMLPDDERIDTLIDDLPWVTLPTEEKPRKKALANASIHLDFLLGDLVIGMQWAHFRDYRLHSSNGTAQMNGTSMATPQVAGILAESIRLDMISQGLQWQGIYGQAGFLPSDMIAKLFAMAHPLKTNADSKSKILTSDSSKAWENYKKTPLGELPTGDPSLNLN